MALALAESANKALRQGASPPYRPPQSRSQDAADTRYQRSLSADAGELLSSDPNQLYSTVRPLSVWMTEGEGNATETAADTGHGQGERTPGQVCMWECARVCKWHCMGVTWCKLCPLVNSKWWICCFDCAGDVLVLGSI